MMMCFLCNHFRSFSLSSCGTCASSSPEKLEEIGGNMKITDNISHLSNVSPKKSNLFSFLSFFTISLSSRYATPSASFPSSINRFLCTAFSSNENWHILIDFFWMVILGMEVNVAEWMNPPFARLSPALPFVPIPIIFLISMELLMVLFEGLLKNNSEWNLIYYLSCSILVMIRWRFSFNVLDYGVDWLPVNGAFSLRCASLASNQTSMSFSAGVRLFVCTHFQ